MYPFYRNRKTLRDVVTSPLTIAMTCTYDTVANTGTVNATVTNTSGGSVSGTIQFVIIENNKYNLWSNLTTVEHVCRKMLPDSSGEAVTIPAGNNIVRSRNFTIPSGWNEKNIKIVCFVQASDKTIYQGAQIGIVPQPKMSYWGLTFVETSGNGNRVAQPGEAIRLYLHGKNNGNGNYTGTATLTTTDTYATIASQTPQTISVGQGKEDTVLLANVNISASCPAPHTVPFKINFGTPADTMTFYFIVANQTGFSDNVESGVGGWTHFGTNDSFHISVYRSHSTSHSWYCGRDANHQYINEQDASLISQWFVSTPDSNLKFWHYYATEVGWDFAYAEIDNGSGWWRPLAQYNGSQTTWTQAIYAMNAYNGQTVRLRFRWMSDPGTVAEGWYIDDIQVPVWIIGVDENNANTPLVNFTVLPNPFRTTTKITFGIEQSAKSIGLKIYDISGRLIKSFSLSSALSPMSSTVTWDGTDLSGAKAASGIYFVQLENGVKKLTEKVLLLK